jgi:hypothetical protein
MKFGFSNGWPYATGIDTQAYNDIGRNPTATREQYENAFSMQQEAILFLAWKIWIDKVWVRGGDVLAQTMNLRDFCANLQTEIELAIAEAERLRPVPPPGTWEPINE